MEKQKESKGPELEHMRVHEAENGGWTVEHHFKPKRSKSMAFMESEPMKAHVFGPEDGHHMLKHIADHMHIPAEVEMQEKENEPEYEREEEP